MTGPVAKDNPMERNIELEFLKIDNNANRAVFMLHGYGASMEDLYGLASYLDPDGHFDWYFPNGHQVINLGFHMQGRAWFPVDMAALERAMAHGHFRNFKDIIPEGMDLAMSLLTEFINERTDDYEDIVIGGFSQGAMLASHLSTFIPKTKAALLFSGVLVAQSKLQERLEENKTTLRFFQSHGKQDPILNFAEAGDLYELLKLYRWQGEFVPFNGAHEIPLAVIQKAQAFLKQLF